MYLKRLEIQGFKSFPEKIRLEFHKGITAVVGPNGSGKSNISDALRWVLGEQSAKSLRGAKMEDIIFAGTQNRKPLSFAEVSMVVDNSDKKLKVDYEELTVTRKVYRSGESLFLINGAACRLKDIHELFLDTGIGKEGYSIIGQGRIESILSAKSEDRRLLFEEAAGIVKYKYRKNEAETKLAREKQNLIRINDIISEIDSQLPSLKAQAEKAEEYLKLAKRQKIVDINIFIRQVTEIEENISEIKLSMEELKSQITDTESRSDGLKKNIEDLKTLGDELSHKDEEKKGDLLEKRVLLEQKQNSIKLALQSIEHLEGDILRLQKEIMAADETAFSKNASIEKLSAQKQSLSLSILEKNREITEKQNEFEEVNSSLLKMESQMDSYSSRHIENLRKTTELKGAHERLSGFYEQIENRNEQVIEEKSLAESRYSDKTVQIQVIEKKLDECLLRIQESKGELAGLQKEKVDFDVEISELKAKLEDSRGKIKSDRERLKLLKELMDNFEGYNKAVKAVLLQKYKVLNGIFGAVGELIAVPEKYETAIEIALGISVQNIITDNEESAKAAISYLKEKKEGRATFLPLSVITPRELNEYESRILKEAGVIGTAQSLIKYEKKFEAVFSSLLGRVIVVENIDIAVNLSKKYSNQRGLRLVTLEGDLIIPGGAITGGSIQKTTTNILSRKREIDNLEEELKRLYMLVDKWEKELEKSKLNREIVFKLIDENTRNLQTLEIEKASATLSGNQAKDELKILFDRKNDLEIEAEQIREQITETNKKMREIVENIRKIENEISELANSVNEEQKSIQKTREARDDKTAVLTNLRIEFSKLSQSEENISENMNRLASEVSKLKAQREKSVVEIDSLLASIENKKAMIASYNSEMDKISGEIRIIEDEISAISDEKSENGQKILTCEENYNILTGQISRLNMEHNKLEMKQEQSKQDNLRIYEEMWEKYEITYRKALEYERLGDRLEKLKNESKNIAGIIRDLGPVNTAALTEYTAVKERFDFLSAQRGDIISAEEKLEAMIRELSKLMESQFISQLKLISESFGIVFKEMFGGGTAYLKLSDENNILESGIDIISQPPGKNLQNMLLFSGGERALTAIALLFGILRMKPSPFCVLDEIEAALDDANVSRFANYLKNFAFDTQFIIITHRKGTMECADSLYGVTMQEHGVSKLVSVKLTDENISREAEVNGKGKERLF